MKSKTIILSSNEKFVHNSPRAILTFIEDNSQIEGKIRLYNLSSLDKSVKIGIYHNQKVISSSLNHDRDCYTFKIAENINLANEIFCALVDTNNSNKVILSGGTNPSFDFSYFEDEDGSDIEDNNDIENNSTTISDIDLNKPNFQDNNSNLDNCINCDCKNCTYKEYFYSKHNEIIETKQPNEVELENLEENISSKDLDSTISTVETTSKETEFNSLQEENLTDAKETKEDNLQFSETENFLNSISEQLNEMFLSYPIDEELTKIIPNSKIVKLTDSVDNSSYVVGVLYENDQIAYLIYGVPSKYNENPPAELGDNYQWLPLDPEDPLSDGYYLIYQDASSGKLVPVKVE